MKHALIGRATAFPQSVRFLLAGGFAAFVNWVVRFPLSILLPFEAAVVAATAIGMMIGFIGYRFYVFPGSARSLLRQLRDFIVVNLVTLVAVAAAASVLRDLLLPFAGPPLAEAVAHAIAIALGAGLNYVAHSLVTFQHRHSSPDFTISQLQSALPADERQ